MPFPGPCAGDTGAARRVVTFAERIATALAGESEIEAGDPRPTIGVELRRETATFHIPVSEASLPEALKKLTGGALRIEAETPADTARAPSAARCRRSRQQKRRRSCCPINLLHRNSMARTSSRHASCAGWWNKPLSEHAGSARDEALRNTCLTEMTA